MIRRRLTFENMKNEVDSIIEYELNPCDYKTVGNFIVDVCDIFTYNFLEDMEASANDKDSLYYYAVDVFGKYLAEIYNEKCGKKNMVTESKDNLNRKANILKKYTEDELSEKPWFDGLDIKISSYQTSHKNKHGVYYVVSVPLLRFMINTKSIPKSISTNDVDKLENLISDIVLPLFNSIFPVDENENPEALWDIRFDFHL
jgi:hypothetical protein